MDGGQTMKTTVSERGQTAVPAAIRAKFGIKTGQQVEWIEDGEVIHLLPVSDYPIRSFRGSAKGQGLTQALLTYRKQERDREHGGKRR